MNLARLNGIGGIDTTLSFCLDLMENPGYVGFNIDGAFGASSLPPHLAEKLVETPDDLCIIYMDTSTRKRFRVNQ